MLSFKQKGVSETVFRVILVTTGGSKEKRKKKETELINVQMRMPWN